MKRFENRFAVCMSLVYFWYAFACANESAQVLVSKKQLVRKKMPLMMTVLGNNAYLDELIHYVNMMLSCKQFKTIGFNTTIERVDAPPTKQYLKNVYEKGSPLLFFLRRDTTHVLWSVFDTYEGKVICAKQSHIPTCATRFFAEHLLDQLWPLLTGHDGFFSTRIACCKERGKGYKDLCLIPPYFNPEDKNYQPLSEVLLSAAKVLAPRWNMMHSMPLVFYSQITDANVCLMSISLDKKQRIVSNFRGLNLLPSFSPCGDQVAFCLSCQGKSNIYIYQEGKKLKKITHNDGNNISPILLRNGDVIFCSDFKDKSPKICYWHADSGEVDILTPGCYATCPAYNEKKHKIAFSAFVDGYMQIHTYDLRTKKQEQTTFDACNKQECSWSPCGNFLVFGADRGAKRLIRLFNCITGEQCSLTSASHRWTYPSWSPRYESPLVIS